jgi:hypothetical protein
MNTNLRMWEGGQAELTPYCGFSRTDVVANVTIQQFTNDTCAAHESKSLEWSQWRYFYNSVFPRTRQITRLRREREKCEMACPDGTGSELLYCNLPRMRVSWPSRLHRVRPEFIVVPDWIMILIMTGCTYSQRSDRSNSQTLGSCVTWFGGFQFAEGLERLERGLFCGFLCHRRFVWCPL